jgi:hypothetical protein
MGTSLLEQHKERILAVVSVPPPATLKEILAVLRHLIIILYTVG